jgi:hypothetical protein
MHSPAFLITIDTEGDNEWANPRPITTHNARYLPRFQSLCERFGFKPTWLSNYEMALCPAFVRFGRGVLSRNAGEVGMHLHAWSNPPISRLTRDDFSTHPYLIEYPTPIMGAKIAFLTELLEQQFGEKMRSHRAGRWAFNAEYAALLLENGYTVDCSVTPLVSWRQHLGDPQGIGGSDYRDFPCQPYFLDLNDLRRAGSSTLLEVPTTIMPSPLARWAPWAYASPLSRRIANRLSEPLHWLRPQGANLRQMLGVVRRALKEGRSHLAFMLHSSELMPGGSPNFPDVASIEALYEDLEALFSVASRHFQGQTLSEFRQGFSPSGSDAAPRTPQTPNASNSPWAQTAPGTGVLA